MATKKEKRAAAAAKRQKMLDEVRTSGLEAQRLDREARRLWDERVDKEIANLNNRHREILAKHGINESDDYADRAKRFAEGFAIGQEG